MPANALRQYAEIGQQPLPRNALTAFLQGASNAAASNISAPVDLISWGLRKAGVPVPQNVVGGSQWMQDKGFTAPVEQSAASLAGETVGLTAPIAAAAKAPQIAAGLLSLDDAAKAQIRQRLESYMVRNGLMKPATAWHGSPHKFDKFDSSKIGTGEGAQAYGHGLYLAESDNVAGSYAGMVGKTDEAIARAKVAKNAAWAKDWDTFIASAKNDPFGRVSAKDIELAQQLKAEGVRPGEMPAGNLYKVELPDEMIARMLDWDKPLSQQPEVLKAMKGTPLESFLPYADKMTGGQMVSQLGNNNTSSEQLRKLGLQGIRYLDGNSRGAGAGTSNYVVFPGEESRLSILERNGQRLK